MRSFTLALLVLAIAGCGGGKGNTNKLFTLRVGSTWVYSVTGTVQNNSLQAGSTLTMSVPAGTVKDLNGRDVNILDRKYDLILPDGRHILANQRLYWSQTSTGIYVHGVNFYSGDVFDSANDLFVPGIANPPFAFLFIADPAVDGLSIQYLLPFGVGRITQYALTLGTTDQQVTTPAGTWIAKAYSEVEQFKNASAADVTITNGAIAPNAGILGGTIDAIFPDGNELKGTLLLKQYTP